MDKIFIGIDLGGTYIKAGLVNTEGKILAEKSIPTKRRRPENEIVADMCCLASALTEQARVDFSRIVAIGVGSPGIIDSLNGTVLSNCNLGWDYVPVARMISQYTGKPAYLLNDANAAALGESSWGAGSGFSSVVLVTLGTGIGSGIVLGGKLVEGFRGAGAELGHMVIRTGGRACGCGRRGCFERYASATALIEQTRSAMRKNSQSLMWEISHSLQQVDGKTAFAAAEAGKVLYDPLREAVRHKISSCAEMNILPASLANNAGLCGAALFAMQKSNTFTV